MASDGVMADTDAIIDFLRGHGRGVAGVRSLITEGRLRVSAITVYELSAGARTDADLATVSALCRQRTLPLSRPAAHRAGEVARDLRARGGPIGAADTMIAGLCLHHGLPLMTGNRQHFDRVAGLHLVPLPDA